MALTSVVGVGDREVGYSKICHAVRLDGNIGEYDIIIPSKLANMRPTSCEINLWDSLGMLEIFIKSKEPISCCVALEKGVLETPL